MRVRGQVGGDEGELLAPFDAVRARRGVADLNQHPSRFIRFPSRRQQRAFITHPTPPVI